MYHFDFLQMMFLNVRNGDENQRNDVSGRLKKKKNRFSSRKFFVLKSYWGGSNLGFSLGSSRPRPAGLSRASSSVIISSSNSTFPFKEKSRIYHSFVSTFLPSILDHHLPHWHMATNLSLVSFQITRQNYPLRHWESPKYKNRNLSLVYANDLNPRLMHLNFRERRDWTTIIE